MMADYNRALHRKHLSSPAKKVSGMGLISGRILDYGCGNGKDAELLKADMYDPNYFPKFPKGKYDTILCTYVLNILKSPKERKEVISKIQKLLKPGGKAYVSVRRDVPKEGTSTQEWVNLKNKSVHRCSSFEVYEIEAHK